jgi:Holliday junction resolvasome RuvABC DNA-binding subunit
MERKRCAGRHAAARAEAEAAREAAALRAQAAAEVIPWLRQLGFRADEARRAASRCEDMPDASLERRVKAALSCLGRHPQGRAAGFMPAAT